MHTPFEEFEKLLSTMVEMQASDLFLSQGRVPFLRVNGSLRPMEAQPATRLMLQSVLQSCLRPSQLEAFTREGDLDFGISAPSCGRFRGNALMQRGSIAMVVRRVADGRMRFEDLGLPVQLQSFAALSRGLVLVTGATGSGKSTTLAAMVHHINAHFARHIVTIEDPVEFLHEDLHSLVTQREVGADTKDFSSALRHVLRESPDVILIGEMRDAETVEVAVSAAMSGHLVISSLHTGDTIQALQRIISFFPEHLHQQKLQDLSLCLEGVVAQRLVPRAGGSGRAAAVEVLSVTATVRKLLREGRLDELSELSAEGAGMHSFNKALLDLFQSGQISLEAGAAYASNPEEFRMNAQGMERGSASFLAEMENLPSVGGIDVRSLLHSAQRHGASDIHLMAGSAPVFRVSGVLRPLETALLTAGDVRRLLFSMLTHPQREQFELERELDFAISLSAGVRFRVNAHYQRQTVAVALRLIPSALPLVETLGLPESVIQLADASQGLVLVTGPTGSGKSTTLASLVDRINSDRNCRVITIEDPIEFVHQNRMASIEQREVGADTKSFASALKYILRQDPDVILVGEMRDFETIQAALTAAETGHLVFASLHTNDAPQAIDRVIDVFPPHQQEQIRAQLASALLGVVSQRLLQRKDGSGRVAAFEVLLANSAVRSMIREGKTHQLLGSMEISFREGMQTLDRSVESLYQSGQVSKEEACRYVRNPVHFASRPPGAEIAASATAGAPGDLDK
jgi:twitching motility protein PilT